MKLPLSDLLLRPLQQRLAFLRREVVDPVAHLALPHEHTHLLLGMRHALLLPVGVVDRRVLLHLGEAGPLADGGRQLVSHRPAQELGDALDAADAVLVELLVGDAEHLAGVVVVALDVLPVRAVHHVTLLEDLAELGERAAVRVEHDHAAEVEVGDADVAWVAADVEDFRPAGPHALGQQVVLQVGLDEPRVGHVGDLLEAHPLDGGHVEQREAVLERFVRLLLLLVLVHHLPHQLLQPCRPRLGEAGDEDVRRARLEAPPVLRRAGHHVPRGDDGALVAVVSQILGLVVGVERHRLGALGERHGGDLAPHALLVDRLLLSGRPHGVSLL